MTSQPVATSPAPIPLDNRQLLQYARELWAERLQLLDAPLCQRVALGVEHRRVLAELLRRGAVAVMCGALREEYRLGQAWMCVRQRGHVGQHFDSLHHRSW